MKSTKDIYRSIELRSLGLDEHECNFLASHFDELSRFFKKAVCIKAEDNNPKYLVFMTPEGRAYERKSRLADCLICSTSILLSVSLFLFVLATTSHAQGWTIIMMDFLLVVLYGASVWWLYHDTFKNLDKLSKWLCRKELEALRSKENKKHLEEIKAGFTQKAVHKFVQHFYFDIYSKVFLSGLFDLSPRLKPVWSFFGLPEHSMQFVVRRMNSHELLFK